MEGDATLELRPCARRFRRMRALYRWGFAVQLTLVVLASVGAYTGVLPTQATAIPGSDKVGHFFMIGLLSFFLDGAIAAHESDAALARRDVRVLGARVPLAAAAVLLVAGLEEYLQRLSPRRDSSIYDYLADVLGVVALTALSRYLEPVLARALDRGASSPS